MAFSQGSASECLALETQYVEAVESCLLRQAVLLLLFLLFSWNILLIIRSLEVSRLHDAELSIKRLMQPHSAF